MTSALSSIFGSNPLQAVMSVASIAFPPLGLATSAANLLLGSMQGGIGQAVSQLCQEFGMPKFVGDMVKQVADQVLGGLRQPSDSDCDAHVGSQGGIQDFMTNFSKDLCNRIVEGTRKNMEKECPHGGKGKGGATAGSWLQAIAIAMGQIAGDKAAQMVGLSEQLSDLNAKGTDLTNQLKSAGDDKEKAGQISSQQQDNAREFSVVQSQFQATSQEFSILQNTFSNAIKSIGEGLTTMGRKG